MFLEVRFHNRHCRWYWYVHERSETILTNCNNAVLYHNSLQDSCNIRLEETCQVSMYWMRMYTSRCKHVYTSRNARFNSQNLSSMLNYFLRKHQWISKSLHPMYNVWLVSLDDHQLDAVKIEYLFFNKVNTHFMMYAFRLK